MNMNFDHAGIAIADAEQLASLYSELFEIPVAHEELFDGLRLVFLDLGDGYFELLEPIEEGTIQRYLDRNGPGIHHLALETSNIDAALTHASELGIDLIDEEPRPGAWNHDVAFLHPNSTGGILIELVQH